MATGSSVPPPALHATPLIDIPRHSAGRTTYTYDQGGRLTGLVNPFAETTTFVHDIAGYEARRELACGVTVSHLDDAAGREMVLRLKWDGTQYLYVLAKYGWRPCLSDERCNCYPLDRARSGHFRLDCMYPPIGWPAGPDPTATAEACLPRRIPGTDLGFLRYCEPCHGDRPDHRIVDPSYLPPFGCLLDEGKFWGGFG